MVDKKYTLSRQRRIRELSIPVISRKITLTRQQESLLLAFRDKNKLSIHEMLKILGIKRARLYRIIGPLVKVKIIYPSTTRPVVYSLKNS